MGFFQVRPLAWYSELRIWHCHRCGIGHICSSDPETPHALGWGKKKRKKKKRWHLDNIWFFLNFILYLIYSVLSISSQATQPYIHRHSFFHIILHHVQHKWSDIVPCALQQDLTFDFMPDALLSESSWSPCRINAAFYGWRNRGTERVGNWPKISKRLSWGLNPHCLAVASEYYSLYCLWGKKKTYIKQYLESQIKQVIKYICNCTIDIMYITYK